MYFFVNFSRCLLLMANKQLYIDVNKKQTHLHRKNKQKHEINKTKDNIYSIRIGLALR